MMRTFIDGSAKRFFFGRLGFAFGGFFVFGFSARGAFGFDAIDGASDHDEARRRRAAKARDTSRRDARRPLKATVRLYG